MDPSVYGYGVQKRPLDDGGRLAMMVNLMDSSMEVVVCFKDSNQCIFLRTGILSRSPCAVQSYLHSPGLLGSSRY